MKYEKLNIEIINEYYFDKVEELDNCIELYSNGILNFKVYHNSKVYAYNSSKVYAFNSSIIDAYDNSKVTARGNSKVIDCGNSKTEKEKEYEKN